MINPIERLRRWRERRELLRLDDQMLADIGCSRALLQQGVLAWPWRAPEDSMARLGRFCLAGRRGAMLSTSPTAAIAPAVRHNRFPSLLWHIRANATRSSGGHGLRPPAGLAT